MEWKGGAEAVGSEFITAVELVAASSRKDNTCLLLAAGMPGFTAMQAPLPAFTTTVLDTLEFLRLPLPIVYL